MKRFGLVVASLLAGASVVACGGGGGGMVAAPGLGLSATMESFVGTTDRLGDESGAASSAPTTP